MRQHYPLSKNVWIPRMCIIHSSPGRGVRKRMIHMIHICGESQNHPQGSHFFYPVKFPDYSLTFPWFPKSFPWFFLSFHQDILVKKNIFITARKRSLGQGNIFTPVCHSVHRGEYLAGTPPQAGTPPLGRYTPLDRYTPLGQVHPLDRYTPLGRYTPRDTVNAWAVCILLECNLVLFKCGLSDISLCKYCLIMCNFLTAPEV